MSGFAHRSRSWVVAAYGPLATRRLWLATLHHLLDLPVAWIAAGFVLAVVAASTALAPLAVVVLAAALAAVRWVSGLERLRAARLLGVRIAAPPPLVRERGFLEWVKAHLKDRVAWRGVGYLVVRFVLGNAAFILTAGIWWAVLALLLMPLWDQQSPVALLYRDSMDLPNDDVTNFVDASWEYGLALLVGLLVLALVPPVVAALSRASGWAARTLLGPDPGEELRTLEVQRTTAVRAVDVDRRRIEQDLHDGAQVRLTVLAMQLGLAREALAEGAGSPRVAELIDDAHAQAKMALKEIRDLARGIHPAILTDRGLDAALSSMVGRIPIPVDLEVDVADRPSPEVESIAYFVAAEGVTNAVRHADSPTVGLRVVRLDDRIVVEIRDRGRGGAIAAPGTGLANLRQRVESTGGELTVVSPEGVGTLLRAVVPCGS